jgi:hypothetical protein
LFPFLVSLDQRVGSPEALVLPCWWMCSLWQECWRFGRKQPAGGVFRGRCVWVVPILLWVVVVGVSNIVCVCCGTAMRTQMLSQAQAQASSAPALLTRSRGREW